MPGASCASDDHAGSAEVAVLGSAAHERRALKDAARDQTQSAHEGDREAEVFEVIGVAGIRSGDDMAEGATAGRLLAIEVQDLLSTEPRSRIEERGLSRQVGGAEPIEGRRDDGGCIRRERDDRHRIPA